ncbi:MAG: TonB-dependent receptor [Thermoanaerobaculia bacterium]|nr:TonB-dependent receptor [Thermoanaerobaculia bacterium]
MRSKRYVLVVAAVIFLFTAPAGAQGLPTGSITGTVTAAADGQPLPGVAITVRSPALQGFRQTSSAGNGEFLLPGLPPGEYTVELQLEGFQPVTREDIRVATTQRQELAVAMSLKAVSEEIVVTAGGEFVSTAPQSATTITGELIDRLPVSRTFESAALLAPDVYSRVFDPVGSTASAKYSIAGAVTNENLVLIDGVSPQDQYWRLGEALYVEDAVAEVTTLTSGISAEYGYFAGGVVNVLTRAGGNALSGSLRSTLVNDAWSTGTPAGEERVDDVTPIWEATAGGPLVKDRIWIFAAGRLRDQTTTSSTAAPMSIDYATSQKETRYNVKLTASSLARHSLTLAASGLDLETNDTDNLFFPVLDLASLYDESIQETMFSANYTAALLDDIFLEAHYGKRQRTGIEGSTDTNLLTGTPILQDPPWIVYHAPVWCSVCPNPEWRDDGEMGTLKLTSFVPSRSLGSHTVVAGGEAYDGSEWENNYQSGTDYAVFASSFIARDGEIYPVLAPGTQLWFMPVLIPAAPNHIRSYSAFVNDTWRLSDRLTFDLGLRWDRNHARDGGGNPISDEDALSPRLSVAWDPSGRGSVRLTASYGRYVSVLAGGKIYEFSPYGMNGFFLYQYDGPPVNLDPEQPLVGGTDALRQLFEWFGITAPGQFPRSGIDPIAVSISGINIQIPEGLESQRADEWALGVNGSIGTRGSFRVEAVERKYGSFYDVRLDATTGTVDDEYGNVYDLGLLTNADEPWERRHRALKTSVQYQFSSGIAVGGFWTWSRTWGNQSGEAAIVGDMGQYLLAYPEYRQLSWHAPTGDLPEDVRHRVRIWATWDIPSLPASLGRLNIASLFSLDTGQPYGEAGEVLIGDYVNNPGYVTPPNTETYWFTNRDAHRTPTVNQLDLALTWSKEAGRVELFVQPRVINVFDNQEIATNDPGYIDKGVLTAYTDPSLQPFDPFHEKPVVGVNYARSPTFGEALRPEAYQQSRSFTISLGARF